MACEPGKVFEFAVTSGPLEVAKWRYEFEDTDSGCRVTESWEDRRKPWFTFVARAMGDHTIASTARRYLEICQDAAQSKVTT